MRLLVQRSLFVGLGQRTTQVEEVLPLCFLPSYVRLLYLLNFRMQLPSCRPSAYLSTAFARTGRLTPKCVANHTGMGRVLGGLAGKGSRLVSVFSIVLLLD